MGKEAKIKAIEQLREQYSIMQRVVSSPSTADAMRGLLGEAAAAPQPELRTVEYISSLATQALGNADLAGQWLRTRNGKFGWARPIDLLLAAERVEMELKKLRGS